GVFSSKLVSNFINEYSFFMNETFNNGMEDFELSLRISISHYKTTYINYRIEPLIASSLGGGYNRLLRDIAGFVYINFLLYTRVRQDFVRK
ncbi:MAG: hypothetical protein ACP5RZ_06385, partial [Thermoplasmata archaeon]